MFSYQDTNHQVVGPLPADTIRQLIGARTVSRHTLLRAEGAGFWQPAAKVDEFRELFERINELDTLVNADNETPPLPAPATPVIDVAAEVSKESNPQLGTSPTTEPTPGNRTEPAAPSSSSDREPEPPRNVPDRYFMIGGDGREYGPVTAAQLREWLTQRRANADTLIRRADRPEFAPLGTWPEFADAFGGPGKAESASSVPPPLDSAKADQLAAEIIGRGYNLSVSNCFSRSWKLYTTHFGLLTGTTALALIIVALLHSVPVGGNLAAVALGGAFSAGLGVVFLKLIRGQKAEVNDVFAGFNHGFVPLLLASTIIFVLVSAGLLFCILPGIYLVVAWLFTYQLSYERGLDFWPAMELSRKVVHERWWEVFALAVVAGILFAVGSFVLIVGVFFTAPIAFGAIMYAYEDIFGEPKP